MYGSNDIQKALDLLRENKEYLDKFKKELSSYCTSSSNLLAIMHVISEGCYEEFDRYDSDVCEQFLTVSEQVFGKDWNVRGIVKTFGLKVESTIYRVRKSNGDKFKLPNMSEEMMRSAYSISHLASDGADYSINICSKDVALRQDRNFVIDVPERKYAALGLEDTADAQFCTVTFSLEILNKLRSEQIGK